ncbi:putative immunity protein [Agromyces indicus]|uniref:Exonuclease SbcC n=1 Tax=Agromyces indicus TaxID=758919 RepID=A0ABU1FIA0_9MICO|nr:exonuclease SbcC [Agromyces indicus]MDR5691489.1 exonuclease SbcC [Agromyces indicus]
MRDSYAIDLGDDDLREVARFAARCAGEVLPFFERDAPDDARPREAIDAAWAFAEGGARTNALRTSAWRAYRATQSVDSPVAAEAAHAASAAAGAAFLHPLAHADQVKHILGSAARAARAVELEADDVRGVGEAFLDEELPDVPDAVVDVLRRYPPAPGGGGRVGELLRHLDAVLRARA